MKRRIVKRTRLWAGIAAAFLLSPVFWALPPRTALRGKVSVETLRYPHWALGAEDGYETDYWVSGRFSFQHRKFYQVHRVYCGAFVVIIRGREVPDMWA